MEIFQFKRFSVQNERSSMKVNTDGVLLGAAMTLRPSDCLLLDIGTGTGTIALMVAQRLEESRAKLESEANDGAEGDFKIIGIDIDCDSAMEAKENFLSSPWFNKLVAEHISLNDFEKECIKKWYNPSDDENLEKRMCGEGGIDTQKFNVIFSNPPYFESSLKSPDERKRTARHAETLSYREIITFASRHLTREAGRLSMILPTETEREAIRYAASFDLRLFRRLRIRTTPSRPFSRVILEFILASPETISNERMNKENLDIRNVEKPAITDDELTIQDPTIRSATNPSGYTPAYRSLVKNFLLI